MKRFEGIVSDSEIRQAISDLEELKTKAPGMSVAAIHVLKNELDPAAAASEKRRILFERTFSLPGSLRYRLRRRLRGRGRSRGVEHLRRILSSSYAWSAGKDAELFRDTCDRYFWEEMVPDVEAGFGELAHPFLNTINEAIINYAEYSFRPWAILRRISAQVFCTEGNLAYGIVRPHGLRQRAFDPLVLKQRDRPQALGTMQRGWGHTLLMKRALFISFDHSVNRRGMMIVVGPDES
jgi:hypothetical protein